MSLKAIIWAWEQNVGSAVAKMILLKLADNTNDETGLCYPKHDTIAKYCECNRRTVIRNIKKLEEIGLLTVRNVYRDGKQISNQYRLNLKNNQNLGVTESHTESVSRTSKSNKEKSIKKKNLSKEKKPAWLPEKIINDFIEHRRQMKKPVTQIGLERLFKKLEQISSQGGDPVDAINNSITNGYQGVFYNKQKNKSQKGFDDATNSKDYSKGATRFEELPEFIQEDVQSRTKPDRTY